MQGSETIVVIDDDKELRTLVEMALAKPGRTVIGFDDGDEALRFLTQGQRVDLVVSDIAMEGYDGHRLLRHLRSEPRTASTPVVFVTDGDELEDGIGGLSDRGVKHLRKPFEIEALRRCADEAVQRGPVAVGLRDRTTGLQTGDQFLGALDAAVQRSAGGGGTIALILLDVGTDGRSERHDEVLGRVAAIVQRQLRETDAAGRLGEGRLASLHAACDAPGATAIAQRIIAAVDADARCRISRLAIGVAATADQEKSDARQLLRSAERALEASIARGGAAIGVEEA